jgi:hypothetical protein
MVGGPEGFVSQEQLAAILWSLDVKDNFKRFEAMLLVIL